MNSYKFTYSHEFKRDYKSLRKDKFICMKIDEVLYLLTFEPFSSKLRTHQVNISSIGKCWSSRVTGDLRILWTFDKNKKDVIIGLRVGGHDTVYK